MADFIIGQEIAALYEEHLPRYSTSMQQMQEARDLLAGRIKAPLDASILPGEADREALRSSTPDKYWLPLRIKAKISRQELRIKREPVGIGTNAMKAATYVEMVDNAAADLGYPGDVVDDLLLNEGAAFVVTQPQMSLWSATPDSMYDDKDERTKVSKRYALDSKGRAQDDEYYTEPGSRRQFKAHESKSAEYFTSVVKDYRARNIPIEQRALSCIEAIPLNPRRKGDQMLVDGLIRKSEWSVSSLLIAGYKWGESGHMEPANPNQGGTRNLTHHELWYKAPNGHIYTSWCIDGKVTERKSPTGDYEDHIDLTEVYGIETMPVAFDYGINFSGAINPDDRPVPFVNIFGRSWLNEDTAKTFMLVRGYKEANLFRAYKPDVLLLQHLGLTDNVPMPQMQPGLIVPVLGDMQDAHSTAGLAEMIELIKLMRSGTSESLPTVDALGGGEDVSAIGRNAAGRDVLEMFGGVMNGRKNIKAQAMSHWNEQAACIGRKADKICLFVNQEIPVEQRSGNQSSTRAIIEVEPDKFGDVWDVSCEVPPKMEDNLAKIQVLGDQHDRGKIPHEWLLEQGYGDPAPDVTLAKINAEKAMNTPLGQARLNMMAAQIAGDEELEQIMKALAQEELMKLMPAAPPTPDNVVPSSIGAGLQPPMMGGQPMPSHMPGTAMGNPVDSQVGGIVNAGIQASTANGSPV
jgi:hypothetical protein